MAKKFANTICVYCEDNISMSLIDEWLTRRFDLCHDESLAAVLGAVRPNPSPAPYPRAYKLVRERTNRLERKI